MLAAIVGVAVAIYISASEYILYLTPHSSLNTDILQFLEELY